MKKAAARVGIVGALLLASAQASWAAPFVQIGTESTFVGTEQIQPGYVTGQGNYRAIDTTNNLAFGIAATVSSTIPGYGPIHNSTFLTDGKYGNGRSWIPATLSGVVTLNLGSANYLGEIKFGRDRLDYYNDRAATGFTLELAGANGIYQTVLSQSVSALVSGAGMGWTLSVRGFDAALATQYIRMTFSGSQPAIDEIEVFAAPNPAAASLMVLGLLGLMLGDRRRRALRPL